MIVAGRLVHSVLIRSSGCNLPTVRKPVERDPMRNVTMERHVEADLSRVNKGVIVADLTSEATRKIDINLVLDRNRSLTAGWK